MSNIIKQEKKTAIVETRNTYSDFYSKPARIIALLITLITNDNRELFQ